MRFQANAWIKRPVAGAVLALTAVAAASAMPLPAFAATSGGWSNLGHGSTATTPAFNDKVQALTFSAGKLYAAGDFTNAGGVASADHVATWNGTAWAGVGAGLGDAASAVYSIAVDGTHVYAGGSFQNAGGDGNADGLAVYDGTSWHAITAFPVNAPVFAMAIMGRTLFVGGSFADLNHIAEADGIAAYNMDTHTWTAITDNSGDLEQVSTIVPDGSGGLIVGGDFINANGIPAADFIARWTGGVAWSALGSGPGPAFGALNNGVDEVAVSGGSVYTGGRFTDAGGVAPADYIARWTGTAWASLGPTPFPVNSRVRTVTVSGGVVIVGGYFNNATGNTKADSIAAFVGGVWRNVGTNANGSDGPIGFNGDLFVLRVFGGTLYAGGPMTIGGSNLNQSLASYRFWQPDALIATTAAYVGNNVYNGTGKKQAKTLTVARNQTGTFNLQLSNDGFATENFQLKGPGSATGYTVHYYQGATDITASVVAGTTNFAIAAGATMALTLKVTVGSGVAVGATHTWLVTQMSRTSGVIDTVKAKVKVG